jgi:hypothetical protein
VYGLLLNVLIKEIYVVDESVRQAEPACRFAMLDAR